MADEDVPGAPRPEPPPDSPPPLPVSLPPAPLPPEPRPPVAAEPFFVPPPALPPAGEYLKGLIRLGLQSFLPAMPAIVLLCFYRFGMGLYPILADPATSPLGYPDPSARWGPILVTAAAYLPLLVLVYSPFLPLQDSLLAGERRSLGECVKHVLERVAPFGLSGLVQLLIVAGPAIAVMAGAVLLSAAFAPATPEIRTLLLATSMLPALLWIAVSFLYLAFATPALLLDDRGPIAAIGESVRLVRRNFGGVFGRFLLFGILFFVASIFLDFPNAMLNAVSAVAGQTFLPARIAGLVWSSVVSAALFPFTVSALLILYRALVPARAASAPAAPAAPPEESAATSPYRFE